MVSELTCVCAAGPGVTERCPVCPGRGWREFKIVAGRKRLAGFDSRLFITFGSQAYAHF